MLPYFEFLCINQFVRYKIWPDDIIDVYSGNLILEKASYPMSLTIGGF